MKTLIFKSTFIALTLTSAAIAQTATPQTSTPACLSGPVNQGNLTVSCTDMNPAAFVFGITAAGADAYSYPARVFAVKAITTDPDVAAVRITLILGGLGGTTPARPLTAVVAMPALRGDSLKPGSPATLIYFFTVPMLADPMDPSFPMFVTGVTVQELKASSSASF